MIFDRHLKTRQRDSTDCGPACIASVAAYYKLRVPVSKIRQMVSTDNRGTNLAGMCEGAKGLGFSVKAVRGDTNSLKEIPLPTIAHLEIERRCHHYVVIYQMTGTHVKIMDPASGRFKDVQLDEFEAIWTGVLLLLVPDEPFQPADQRVSVLSRLWLLLKPHRRVLCQILFGAVTVTILGLSTALFVQIIVDYVLPDINRGLLNLAGAGMIVILVSRIIIGALKSVFTIRTGQLIDARLVLGYFRHLIRLPQPFFDSMKTGEIISRINDAVKIRVFINETGIQMAVNLCTLIAAFALMFTWYWKLGLVMALVVPLYLIIYGVVNRLNRKTQRSMMEKTADLESRLVTSLESISTIKLFGLESYTSEQTEFCFIRLLKSVYRSGMNSLFSSYSTRFISDLFTIILLWVGSVYVIEGLVSPGELLSFYAVTGYFTGPVNETIGMNRSIQDAMIAADRLFEIMDLEQEKSSENLPLSRPFSDPIHFRRVNFSYGSGSRVFEDFTLTIHPGQITALVGENGSGKSTLMKLLLKLYPLSSGQILIGNKNINRISTDEIRRMAAVVPQKVDLFPGSLKANIAVGENDPDISLIDRLCDQLGMNQFVESLPEGYSTWLGENGTFLSGGQSQKVAIARALYRQPDIIFFDEATSSLDLRSVKYIERIIKLLRDKGKTVITISHRFSGLVLADKICLIKNGRLAEEGTHEELLQSKRDYYNLWKYRNATNGLHASV